mgnify:FL=1
MRRLFSSFFDRPPQGATELETIQRLRHEYGRLNTKELRRAAADALDLTATIAIAAVIASRVLGQEMFDTQIRGALALAGGCIAEMQTGEGKTLAATPALVWLAALTYPL